jgi:hypothetical protein
VPGVPISGIETRQVQHLRRRIRAAQPRSQDPSTAERGDNMHGRVPRYVEPAAKVGENEDHETDLGLHCMNRYWQEVGQKMKGLQRLRASKYADDREGYHSAMLEIAPRICHYCESWRQTSGATICAHCMLILRHLFLAGSDVYACNCPGIQAEIDDTIILPIQFFNPLLVASLDKKQAYNGQL